MDAALPLVVNITLTDGATAQLRTSRLLTAAEWQLLVENLQATREVLVGSKVVVLPVVPITRIE